MSVTEYMGLTFLFLVGLPVGTFLSTAIDRLAFTDEDFYGPEVETEEWYYNIPLFSVFLALPLFTRFKVLLPAAACPNCHNHIPLAERIPIYSYFKLGFRCSTCRYPIPGRYWLIELTTAVLFVITAVMVGFTGKLLSGLLLVCLFMVATVVDFKYQIIPDEVTVVGLITGFSLAAYNSFSQIFSVAWAMPNGMTVEELSPQLHEALLLSEGSIGWALTGFMAGAGALTAIYYIGTFVAGTDAMGQGDVKIAGFIGLFLGAKAVLTALFLSTILGAASGVIVMILGWGTREGSFTKFAFGPYICAGSLITFYFSDEVIINLYVRFNEHIVMYISNLIL